MNPRRTALLALAGLLLAAAGCPAGPADLSATQPASPTEPTATSRPTATQRAVPGIPLIGDLGTLRQKPSTQLPRDWQARVGISWSGQQGGPWMVLYCLATYAGEDSRPNSLHHSEVRLGEPLGPLSYSIQKMDPPDARLVLPAPRREHFLTEKIEKYPPAERLYAAVIPLTHKGRWLVRVYGMKGDVLARRVLTVKAPLSTPWAPLLENTSPVAPRQKLVRDGTPVPVARDVHAVLPRFQGRQPLWVASTGPQPVRRGRFLPGTLPPVGGWEQLLNLPLRERKVGQDEPAPLSLKVDKGALLVESRDIAVVDGPRHILARWWVNDKPLYPPIYDTAQSVSQSELVRAAARLELRVACQWPDFVKPVRAGDRVGVQVLYCPDGYELVLEPGHCEKLVQALMLRSRHPLLSNRAEFRVTAGMLRQRAESAEDGKESGESGSSAR